MLSIPSNPLHTEPKASHRPEADSEREPPSPQRTLLRAQGKHQPRGRVTNQNVREVSQVGLTTLQTGKRLVCAQGQAPGTWALGTSPHPSPQVRQLHQLHPPHNHSALWQLLSLVGSWPERSPPQVATRTPPRLPSVPLSILTTVPSARGSCWKLTEMTTREGRHQRLPGPISSPGGSLLPADVRKYLSRPVCLDQDPGKGKRQQGLWPQGAPHLREAGRQQQVNRTLPRGSQGQGQTPQGPQVSPGGRK